MKNSRKRRSGGGDIKETMNPSRGVYVGIPTAVRSKKLSNTPAYRLSEGKNEGQRTGATSKSLAMGMPGGKRRTSAESFAKGGKVHQTMKAFYNALHSHFENEPQMKKLRATRSDVYQGEPHRYKRTRKG